MNNSAYTSFSLRSELSRLLVDELGEYRLPGLVSRFVPSIYVGDPPDGTRFGVRKLEVIIPRLSSQVVTLTSDGAYLYETWSVVFRQHDLDLSTQNAIYIVLKNYPDIQLQSSQQINLANKRTVEQRIVNFRQFNFLEDN